MDAKERSCTYLSEDAWLRAVIADAWASAQAEAEAHPESFASVGLYWVWNELAVNALSGEVLH